MATACSTFFLAQKCVFTHQEAHARAKEAPWLPCGGLVPASILEHILAHLATRHTAVYVDPLCQIREFAETKASAYHAASLARLSIWTAAEPLQAV